jgi:hypothetical protein
MSSLTANSLIQGGPLFRGQTNSEYEQIQDRFKSPIINEVGTRDIWPAIAESVTYGYGSAGTYGFRRPLVRDRWHNGAHHGYFLDSSFCRRFWIPFLRDGTINVASKVAEPPPNWLKVLTIAKLKHVLALGVLIVTAAGLYYSGTGWLYSLRGNEPAGKQDEVAMPSPAQYCPELK